MCRDERLYRLKKNQIELIEMKNITGLTTQRNIQKQNPTAH